VDLKTKNRKKVTIIQNLIQLKGTFYHTSPSNLLEGVPWVTVFSFITFGIL
jgi:hypothetical protein